MWLKNKTRRLRPREAIIKPDNQECWKATGEHGILPPASLQANDPPKVFSLTLTTAYKKGSVSAGGTARRRRGALMASEGEDRKQRRKPPAHCKMQNTSVKWSRLAL